MTLKQFREYIYGCHERIDGYGNANTSLILKYNMIDLFTDSYGSYAIGFDINMRHTLIDILAEYIIIEKIYRRL